MSWKRLRPGVLIQYVNQRSASTGQNIVKSSYPSVPIPSTSFPGYVLSAIKKYAANNRTAFIRAEDNKPVTYKNIVDSAYALATFLSKNGFHEGVASAVLPNNSEFSSLFLGVTLNGGILTSVSPVSTEYELLNHFLDSEARLVITNQQSLQKVLKAAHKCPSIKMILCMDTEHTATLPSGIHNWKDIMETAPDNNFAPPQVDADKEPVFMPYSSGTSGTPKGVMLTHRNMIAMMNIFTSHDNARMTGAMSPPFARTEDDKEMLVVPFYHCYGFGMMMTALLSGATSVLLPRFKPELFCSAIQEHKVRWLTVAPLILTFLAKSPTCQNYDLSSLQVLFSGSAPAPKNVCEELIRKYKNIKHVMQGYGMSETSMASHLPDLVDGQPLGSVGKVAPNLEMKIVDPDTGEEKGRGESGEICIRGATVMLGYYRKPEMTRKCIKDGWLHTGDVGYVDDEGYLFIVDRIKELIKVKGFQVSPAELEDTLLEHPHIHEAAVIGVKHEQKGEVPKAYVVRKCDELSEEEVQSFVKDRVSPHKHLIGGVEFVKELPKSPAGKVLKRVLRERNSISK